MKYYTNDLLSSEQYHADRMAISSSVIKTFLHDPRSYYDKYVLNLEQPPKSSAALIQGSHLHTCILEPEKLDIEYAVYPGAVKRGKEWEEFERKNKGKTILTSSQNDLSTKLVKNFRDTKVILGISGKEIEVRLDSFFEDGFAEESIFGELCGSSVKVRFDYRRDFPEFGSINDLKTTVDTINNVKDARAICERMDYDLSAALYVDMASQYFGKPYYFYFTFLSKTDYKATIFKASEEFIKRGREKYEKGLAGIQAAKLTGNYFSAGVEEL